MNVAGAPLLRQLPPICNFFGCALALARGAHKHTAQRRPPHCGMLPVWALLLCDVRSNAPRRGNARPALLRGGAQSQLPQTLRELSDSDADALWENVSAVWTDVSALWNRTRRDEALLVAAAHATPLLLELGQRLPAGEYSLPLDESTKLTLLEMLDGSKLTLAARRPRRIRKPELAAITQALLDAFGSQLTAASLGSCRRWALPPDDA